MYFSYTTCLTYFYLLHTLQSLWLSLKSMEWVYVSVWKACQIKHLNKSHHYHICAYTTAVSHWCQYLKLNVNIILNPSFNYLWILIIPHIISMHKQDFTEQQVVLTVSKIVKSPLIILEEWMWLDFFHTIPPQSSCSVNNSISFYKTPKYNIYRVKPQNSISPGPQISRKIVWWKWYHSIFIWANKISVIYVR